MSVNASKTAKYLATHFSVSDTMVIGVTMVNVLPGSERIAFNELNKIEGIKDIYHVFGEYDFVVIIEVDDLGSLNSIVDLIRETGSVTATQTIVGAELK
ncbi:Lrp/AsnC ligand binding domain-containing protein [Methanolobus psychrotolerans]|uniref:Lrp/AsnC ligand binding domain-containing protein n=1 Tax=Methanolobus psychrotolerans TaxID=1874706 RepID=UPI001F5DF905|nr:Lrp/AsnC ligand binding domain-containing protein [Methanolobus psychrotolerans]